MLNSQITIRHEGAEAQRICDPQLMKPYLNSLFHSPPSWIKVDEDYSFLSATDAQFYTRNAVGKRPSVSSLRSNQFMCTGCPRAQQSTAAGHWRQQGPQRHVANLFRSWQLTALQARNRRNLPDNVLRLLCTRCVLNTMRCSDHCQCEASSHWSSAHMSLGPGVL